MSNVTNPDAGALPALVEQHAGENFLRALPAQALYHIMEAKIGETALEEREGHAQWLPPSRLGDAGRYDPGQLAGQ